jgi:hypothetical protein
MEAEEDAQAFWDGPDELAMGHILTNILGHMQAEQNGAFLGAAWADAALFAGEGDEELVFAVWAADAGEAVLEIAAFEESGDGLVNDRPPEAELAGVALGVDGSEALEVFAKEAMEVGFKGLTGLVDGGGIVEDAGHGGPRVWLLAASLRSGLLVIS